MLIKKITIRLMYLISVVFFFPIVIYNHIGLYLYLKNLPLFFDDLAESNFLWHTPLMFIDYYCRISFLVFIVFLGLIIIVSLFLRKKSFIIFNLVLVIVILMQYIPTWFSALALERYWYEGFFWGNYFYFF